LMGPTQEQAETASDQMDFNDNPLKCPLDLSRMDLGSELSTLINIKSGDTRVNKLNPTSNKNLIKNNSDLSVFSSNTRKPKQAPKIKPFVSPYERYRLLVPYLEKLKGGEESAETKDQKSTDTENVEKKAPETKEEIHLESIMKHFQKLTDMTPKPKKEVEVESESEEDEIVEDEEEEAVQPKKLAGMRKRPAQNDGPNNEKKKKLLEQVDKEVEKRKLAIENKLIQEEINQKKKKNKRKSDQNLQGDTQSKVPKEDFNYEKEEQESDKEQSNEQDTPFDYNNVDFSDMFKPEKPDDSKVFNPHGNRYIKKKEKRVNRSGHKVNKR